MKGIFVLLALLLSIIFYFPGIIAQSSWEAWNSFGSMADDELIFYNGDLGAVSNNPPKATVFTLDHPRTITLIRTYHWNFGQGSAPGENNWIALRDQAGMVYGPWPITFTHEGMGGVPHAYWVVSGYNPGSFTGDVAGSQDLYPLEIVLPEGTYTVLDSDPDTWSYDSGSNDQGFTWIYALKEELNANNTFLFQGLSWTVVDDPFPSEPSQWAVKNDTLQQLTNVYRTDREYEFWQGTHVVAGDPSWDDYELSFNLTTGDDDGVGAIVRYQDKDNYYRFIMVQDSGNGGPFRRLEKFLDGQRILLAETKEGYTPGQRYWVQLKAVGDHLEVFIDGQRILSAKDSSFRSGQIGFLSYASPSLSVWDVKISDLKEGDFTDTHPGPDKKPQDNISSSITPSNVTTLVEFTSLAPTIVTGEAEQISRVITPEGGILEGGGIMLILPPGALPESSEVVIKRIEAPEEANLGMATDPQEADSAIISDLYDFGPAGIKFSVPVKMVLWYNASCIPPGSGPEDLEVVAYDGVGWKAYPCDPSGENSVSITTTGFPGTLLGVGEKVAPQKIRKEYAIVTTMKRHYNYFAEKLGLKKGISPPSPPYSSLPTPRRFYSGPCPIGEQGAPQLKDPGYTSGALCRGACGSDCPPNRCTETDEVISLPIEGGTCYYSNVVKCPTHKGCRDHDCCYDWCSELGETDITGVCHSECNQRCYNEYGRVNCTAWSNLPAAPVNFISSTGGAVVDWVTGPEYDGELIFSDPPVFYPSEETCTLCKGKDVCYYALEPFDAQNPPWRSDDGRAYVEFHPKGDFFNMDGEPYVVIHNFPSKRPCPPPDDLVIEDELWYKVDKEGNIHHYDTVLGKVTCSEVTFTYKWSECCGSLGPKLSCSTGWIEGETTQRFAYYGE